MVCIAAYYSHMPSLVDGGRVGKNSCNSLPARLAHGRFLICTAYMCAVFICTYLLTFSGVTEYLIGT